MENLDFSQFVWMEYFKMLIVSKQLYKIQCNANPSVSKLGVSLTFLRTVLFNTCKKVLYCKWETDISHYSC